VRNGVTVETSGRVGRWSDGGLGGRGFGYVEEMIRFGLMGKKQGWMHALYE
jgi:hypothetical protein